jgi:hypothetical protein
LALAAYLWHHAWIGSEILEPLHNLSRRNREEQHPLYDSGLLARLSEILAEYGLSWEHIRQNYQYEWEERDKIGDQLQQLVEPVFIQMVTEMAEGTRGMPRQHQEQMLRHMGLPTQPARPGARAPSQQPHQLMDVPLYLFVDGDLPRAGLWMRMPYLRMQFRGAPFRASCAWCGERDAEHGYHLIRCSHMPPRLKERRALVLKAILEDAKRGKSPPAQGESETSTANYSRLFHLYWGGVGEWKKGAKKGPSRRSDAGEQPDRDVLVKALWYVRILVNTYRKATAGTGPGGTNPVWELPVYGKDPFQDQEDHADEAELEQRRGGMEAAELSQSRPSFQAARDTLASSSVAVQDQDNLTEVSLGGRTAGRCRPVTSAAPESLLSLPTLGEQHQPDGRPSRGRTSTREHRPTGTRGTSTSRRSSPAAPRGNTRQPSASGSGRARDQSRHSEHGMGTTIRSEHGDGQRAASDYAEQRDHGRDGKETRPARGEIG